ncbi:Voltagegated ion channel, partial [Globisporangium splendens]
MTQQQPPVKAAAAYHLQAKTSRSSIQHRPLGDMRMHSPPPKKRASYLWLTLRKNIPAYVGHPLKQRFHRRRVPRFRINPEALYKRLWDFLLALFVLYTACVVPYRVCFHRDAKGAFALAESVVDVMFFIDIVLNFFTGIYLPSGEITYSSWLIVTAYLRGWFAVDFFSTMPFDLLFGSNGEGDSGGGGSTTLLSTKLLRSLKVLKLFKLVRIRRLGAMFTNLEDAVSTNQSPVSLVKLALSMLFFAHIVACVWYAVGLQNTEQSWILDMQYDTIDLEHKDLLKYLASVYWAIVMMATIGYGDIVARNNEERLVNIAVMAIGVSFFGYVIGTISSLVTNLDVAAALCDERMTVVKEYILSRQIPKHMSKKICDHFEYYFQNRSVFKERKILKRLPSALRNEMIRHVYAKLVSSIKYFTQCHESLISDIVMLMHPCSVLEDEYVYVQHEIAAHVFFLMEVYDHEHGNGVRMCSAVANSFCELTFLSREAILKLSEWWPEVLKHFRESARENSKRLRRRAGASSLGDDMFVLFRDQKVATTMVRTSVLVKKSMHQLTKSLTATTSTGRASSRISPFNGHDEDDAEEVVVQHRYFSGNFDASQGLSLRELPLGQVEDDEDELAMSYNNAIRVQPAKGKKQALASLAPLDTLRKKPMSMSFNNLAIDRAPKRKDSLLASGAKADDYLPKADGASKTEPPNDVAASDQKPDLHVSDKVALLPTDENEQVHSRNASSAAPNDSPSPRPQRSSFLAQPAEDAAVTVPTSGSNDLHSMVAKIRSTTMPPPRHNIHAEMLLLKGSYLLHPQQPFLVTWQFVVGLMIMYSIVVVPLRLGFSYDAVGGWFILELSIDGFFFLDILLNFSTAFFNDEKMLIYNASVICKKYAKGWFVPDLISTIPFGDVVSLFFKGADAHVNFFPTKLLRLTRVARLLKLTRLIKLSRVFGKIREIVQMNPWAEQLLRLMLMMSLFCHWSACLFHAALLASESQGLPNWCVNEFFRGASAPPPNYACSDSIPLLNRYIVFMYWAFTTLTTVGYGDASPNVYSVYELCLVIILIVVNATIFGYIVSSVMSLIHNFNPSDREYKLLMNEMKDYLRDSSVSARLCANVKVHYKHNITCTSLFPKKKIFDKLAPNLRFDIARLVATETLFAIPLITVMEDAFKGFVSYALFQLKPICIVQSEKVCRSGGPGTEMFFLVDGECDFVNSHTGKGRIVSENAVFEQYALMAKPEEIYRTVSTATAITKKCILYSFTIQDFKALEDVSPAVSAYFLSQLAAVLIEDDLYELSPVQKANVDCALRKGQTFRSVAEHHHRTQLNSLGKVALAKLYPRRGSEWSPDLLPRQLKLLEDEAKKAIAQNVSATATPLATARGAGHEQQRASITQDDATVSSLKHGVPDSSVNAQGIDAISRVEAKDAEDM